MGGVGVLAATWALFFPPAHPRGVLENQGDTPRTPAEGESPAALPLSAEHAACDVERAGLLPSRTHASDHVEEDLGAETEVVDGDALVVAVGGGQLREFEKTGDEAVCHDPPSPEGPRIGEPRR